MNLKQIVAEYLIESANKIVNDECGLDNPELLYLASQVMHVKVNKNQAADFLHLSTRTFDRKISEGILPVGKKDIG